LFFKPKMADGRHFKRLKLSYPRNHFSRRNESLHRDAQRQSAHYQRLKI